MDESSAQVLAPFVPRLLLRRLAAEPSPPREARVETFPAAVLLADIVGFTALTESLRRSGVIGVERLSGLLNTVYGELIDHILLEGGDILKFAGDAVFVVWTAPDGDLRTATLRAARCALAAQGLLHDRPIAQGVRLALKVGIGSGETKVLHLGGVLGRWELVATGDPLVQMSLASRLARPGQVVVSRQARKIMEGCCRGDPTEEEALLLYETHAEVPFCEPEIFQLPAQSRDALRAYIPAAVNARLEQEQVGWLGELRRLTALFINFPGLSHETPVERAQKVMEGVQNGIYRYEGSINKISVDDKGASILAALGLPPLAHEDDPSRAVQAARDISRYLQGMQVRHHMGIATGQVFCGSIGNNSRREYTMIGGAINLAARLMQAAANDILCDEATFRECRNIDFEEIPSLALKGLDHPVTAYRPHGAPKGAISTRRSNPLVGRKEEMRIFEESLDRLLRENLGGVLILEGEAGIGKSRLLEEWLSLANERGAEWLLGSASAVDSSTPYHGWRDIFVALFRPAPLNDAAARRREVLRLLDSLPGSKSKLAALLNPVLGLDFAESDEAAALEGAARVTAANELLIDVLRRAAPVLRMLVLDGAHWLDSASCALLLAAAQRMRSALFIVCSRPMEEPPEEFLRLLRLPTARRVSLGLLADSEVLEMVCQNLGVEDLPAPVATLIREKAEGHPLFSEELTHVLRESGLIDISKGRCRLIASAQELELPGFSATLQGVITSRIDRLASSQQLLLKVASVIGRDFGFAMLHGIHPMKVPSETLLADLSDLLRLDLVERKDPTDDEYLFRHSVVQEVTYNLMLFSQRWRLHEAAARWIEHEKAAADLASLYPLLALHWSRAAEDPTAPTSLVGRAVDCLEQAGKLALGSGAYREAVGFFGSALELLGRLPDDLERAERELTLQVAIGGPLIATRGFASPEVRQAYARAWQLVRKLPETPQTFPVLRGLWNFNVVKTQLTTARQMAEELLQLARKSGTAELLLPAHRAVGETLLWLGLPSQARDHLEEVTRVYRSEEHHRISLTTGQDPGVMAYGFLAWIWWLLGWPDRSLRKMKQAQVLARGLSHPHSVAITLQNFIMVRQYRREPEEARRMAEELVELSRQEGFEMWWASGNIMLGWALAVTGSAEEGIGLVRRGLEAWRATGAELATPYYRYLLAEALSQAGSLEEGRATLEDALSSSAPSEEAWWRSEIFRLKGELLWKTGRSRDARQWIDRAADLAGEQRARALELRALASLCRLTEGSDDGGAEARRRLKQVYELFTEGFDTPDLREARRILGR